MKNSAGLTLVEIMIVTAIIAATLGTAMTYIGNRNSDTKKFLRNFTVLSRELHNRAKLQGVVYRLVIDMGVPGDGSKKTEHLYWVERGNAKFVLSETEEEKALERDKESDPEKKKDPKGFEIDTSLIKQKSPLPGGLRFDRVELNRLKNPVNQGKAFIHYLPQGLTDEAAIHIKGMKNETWTVAIHPLTGKAELISKSLALKDMQGQ